MNIAVFGATGFSGRVVVEKALKLHDVIALVRNPTASGHRHQRLKLVDDAFNKQAPSISN